MKLCNSCLVVYCAYSVTQVQLTGIKGGEYCASIDVDISHEKIPGLKIANPRAVFRGLTYGQWAGVWMNNFFSDYPDVQP